MTLWAGCTGSACVSIFDAMTRGRPGRSGSPSFCGSRTERETMKLSLLHFLPAAVAGLLQAAAACATNPLIMDQFTADPTARVFEGKLYVYPSHDIKAPPGYTGKPNWFVMEDYHVFSSENLTDWKDHGVILTRSAVQWADPNAYAMWAPERSEEHTSELQS